MYHPIVRDLDAVAIAMHPHFPYQSKRTMIVAGEVQRALHNPAQSFPRRFFDAQWCWALGHIGLLYQAVRWFHVKAPSTELVLETRRNVANRYFLNALKPFVTMYDVLPTELVMEAAYNAVYFGCPDGVHHIHDWVKVAERECEGVNLLRLECHEQRTVDEVLDFLGIGRPFVAVQARAIDYDSTRNVNLAMVEQAIAPWVAKGFDVVSTGIDEHPINSKVPNVLKLAEPKLASFLLSAACDHFIGSDSGAWTIPWAYRRPVTLMNDDKKAWIYP